MINVIVRMDICMCVCYSFVQQLLNGCGINLANRCFITKIKLDLTYLDISKGSKLR